MKIQAVMEIIEPEVRSYDMSKKKFHDYPTGYYHRKTLGGGRFSTVSADRDPHLVLKTSKSTKQAGIDGYWFFIHKVIENKLWENPYFPRVYQFKKFFRGKKAHYRVQLETLVPMTAVSVEEQKAIARKMFGESPKLSSLIDDPELPGTLPEVFITLIGRMYNGHDYEGIDPYLEEAVESLRDMYSDYRWDLHTENIMARRGPHGLHLVITDPFSFKAE